MHSVSSRWRKPKSRKTKKMKSCAVNVQKRWSDNNNSEDKISETNSIPSCSNNENSSPIVVSSNDLPAVSSSKTENTTSASSRKMEYFTEEHNISKLSSFEYIFINCSALKSLFENLACGNCGRKSVELFFREKHGFSHKLVVKCEECENVNSATYSSPRTSEKSQRPSFDINRRVVDSFLSIGKGHAAVNEFCASMGMTSLARKSYDFHFSKLMTNAVHLRDEILSKSREVVRREHIALNPSLRDEDVLDIAVSYDGSWHKRGHTSLYGIGAVVDILTGLVVDYQVMSKYCHMCSVTAAELGPSSVEFSVWQQGHKESGRCASNFDGTSGAMEVGAAELIWKRSISNAKLRYTTVLSDGDAKTIHQLNSKKVYGSTPVEKEECVNHVAKRMGTGLRNLVKEWQAKGEKLGGRGPATLKESTINALTFYYRTAIAANVPDVEKMKRHIYATLSHCMSTDNNPQHTKCPDGVDSWCFWKTAEAKGETPQSHEKMKVRLTEKLVVKMFPLYKRLASDELLKRCTRGQTQNRNESLHSVIWQKCPKQTFVSKSRVDLAVANAVGEFNMGSLACHKMIMTINERELCKSTIRISDQHDRARKRKCSMKAKDEKKIARKRKKQSKTVVEERKKAQEGDMYGPGKF